LTDAAIGVARRGRFGGKAALGFRSGDATVRRRGAVVVSRTRTRSEAYYMICGRGAAPGTIILQGRPPPYRHCSAVNGHCYLPGRQRDQLACLRLAAQQELGDREPFAGPVQLMLHVTLRIPKSWSKRKQNDALIGNVLPGTRSDLTNLLKLSEDACSGVVFTDDALVCSQLTQNRYGAEPEIMLSVSLLEERKS
jgi:Holliday junction resolvase RusA-like endonuclease